MVKLIMGLSGSGKTKTLISLVSEAIEKEQGNVVCIEKSRHLTYDIPYQARLIRTDDYGVRGNTMLLGFLCGLHAGNYDITHFFIDDLNKILDDRSNEALEKFLDTLSAFGERENINFTITITAEVGCTGETGVEMEALTAASVAALTVYDMCKAVQRDIRIGDICLLYKSGGKSGEYKREDAENG